ncbi:MAG: aldo/keto reductase [Steroidobacteraceae bacterium]
MQTRPYGRTGIVVPVLGFGAMQVGDPRLPESDAERVLTAALDLGLTLIDTARSYGLAEERIGRHLAHRRSEFVLSTKVGYGVDGLQDWTHDCIVAGVEAACRRLRTDVIDIVHLHSCGIETLRAGEVTAALARCVEQGKVRVAAYSGDDEPLRAAIADGRFGGVQASVNLCDQQALGILAQAAEGGIGTIAKRPLAGRPWASPSVPTDAVHAEYYRRFEALRPALPAEPEDRESLALRFAAHAPGVDCAIVGGTDVRHLERNAAVVAAGPPDGDLEERLRAAFDAAGPHWRGLV